MDNSKKAYQKNSKLDPILTKQHFSTKIYKVYLKYIRSHYPEISLEGICERAGLPYEYIADETNWVSAIFDLNFTLECLKATNDPAMPFKAGLISLTQEDLGSFLYYFLKYTLSTIRIYRTISAQTLNFSKIMSMEVVSEKAGFIHIKYHPVHLETLNEIEKKALLKNLDNIYQSAVGYLTSVPTIHNQKRAEVKSHQESGPDGISELHMHVSYHNRRPFLNLTFLTAIIGLIVAGLALDLPYFSGGFVITALTLKIMIISYCLAIMAFIVLLISCTRQRKIKQEAQQTIDKMDRQYRDLQKTKEILQENEILLRKMANNYPHSFVAIIEKDFAISFLSGLELKRQNIDPDKLIGLPLEKVFPFNAAYTRQQYQKTFNGEEVAFELNQKDQHYFCRAVPLYSRNNAIPRILVVMENITERKQLEDRIQQSQKMEAIGTLAGGIAHDFNNLLYAMIGYTEMTMDDVKKGSLTWNNLNEILRSATRAKDMVQQILTFSRKNQTSKMPIRVQPILEEVLKLLKTSIPKSIEIKQRFDDQCGSVMADSTQIHQVIMNLATNAYQAMQGKSGTLELTLTEKNLKSGEDNSGLPAGKYIRLMIRDTGCGIDKAIMDKIFDPYFTTKGPGKGTGMGLAVAHGIIKDHGGEIKVLSEIDQGTTFSVYLPTIEAEPHVVLQKTKPPLPTGSEHILIVDDEESVVKMLQQVLKRLGYKVTALSKSLQAVEEFKSQKDDIELVITDMTMPEMNGVDLTIALRKIRPDIPVIICTGYSDLIDRRKADKLGIKSFLMKPTSKEKIATTVREILDSIPTQ